MNHFYIHDNIFIAAGRQLGYILNHDDILKIRNQYKLFISDKPATIDYNTTVAVMEIVKGYIKSCELNNKPLTRIDVK